MIQTNFETQTWHKRICRENDRENKYKTNHFKNTSLEQPSIDGVSNLFFK